MTSEQHRLFGRHSKIPECCIEAFVADIRDNVYLKTSHIPLYAQYRVCDECIVLKRIPTNIHICTEACRETLLSFGFSAEKVQGILHEGGRTIKSRQQRRLMQNVYKRRCSAMEFDYGPAPGVRPFEHLSIDQQFDEEGE